MIGLRLRSADQRPLTLLALGAHPDDIEIGCGGTLLALADAHPGTTVRVNVLTGVPERAAEATASAEKFLPGCTVVTATHTLRDGRVPAQWGEAKELLERVAATVEPDVIFAPRADDAHQDHRLLAELVGTVWRDHLVLGYEIPKYDGDLGQASLYVPLTDGQVREKVRLLHKNFPSQAGRDWFDEDVFLGLARLRGVECRHRYAEAFAARKLVMTW